MVYHTKITEINIKVRLIFILTRYCLWNAAIVSVFNSIWYVRYHCLQWAFFLQLDLKEGYYPKNPFTFPPPVPHNTFSVLQIVLKPYISV